MNRIYAKYQNQKRFAPMDLARGVQVTNLIYASLLTDEEAQRFMERDAPKNPDWIFEVRSIVE